MNRPIDIQEYDAFLVEHNFPPELRKSMLLLETAQQRERQVQIVEKLMSLQYIPPWKRSMLLQMPYEDVKKMVDDMESALEEQWKKERGLNIACAVVVGIAGLLAASTHEGDVHFVTSRRSSLGKQESTEAREPSKTTEAPKVEGK